MQTFCSSYIFPPIDKYAGSPSRDPFYGIAHLNTARRSATVVPAEKLEPGYIFLSNFKTKHSRPGEKRLERECSNRYRGGIKKDTCGSRTDCAFTTPWLLIVSLEHITPANLTDHSRW